MQTQPTPTVSSADVERVVRRDFAHAQVNDVLVMLDEYGHETWQAETDRVRLACLKLASGSIERLRSLLKGAKSDYRDVLAPAEYPNYLKRVAPSSSLQSAEVEEIVNADWAQYQNWLNRR